MLRMKSTKNDSNWKKGLPLTKLSKLKYKVMQINTKN